jgi:HNH endonuclease
LGRRIAAMHRDPNATQGGNAQKRIRICIEKPVSPEQLVVPSRNTTMLDCVPDGPPSQDETERQYLRAARRGQGAFRDALLSRFNQACAVTGISNLDLLVASHIKPWSTCTNVERLDPQNGILLSAMMDRLFDKGLITLDDNGSILISPRLSPYDRALCGLDRAVPVGLSAKGKHYLDYHRRFQFKST